MREEEGLCAVPSERVGGHPTEGETEEERGGSRWEAEGGFVGGHPRGWNRVDMWAEGWICGWVCAWICGWYWFHIYIIFYYLSISSCIDAFRTITQTITTIIHSHSIPITYTRFLLLSHWLSVPFPWCLYNFEFYFPSQLVLLHPLVLSFLQSLWLILVLPLHSKIDHRRIIDLAT